MSDPDRQHQTRSATESPRDHHADDRAPGKRTLTQDLAGGGVPRIQLADKPKEKKKAKSHGFSEYGGGTVRAKLVAMTEAGQLKLSGKQIALLDAVAQVETGGQIACVQTTDDQVVSVGFKQVVLGHGSLEKIMKKAPAGFQKHGLSLDMTKTYSHKDWDNPHQIAGVEDEEELRGREWGMKFYAASMEPDVIAAMCELALKEVGNVERAVEEHAAGVDLFTDPTAQGWLLETYNNRPYFMELAVKLAMENGAKSAPSRDAFLDILAAAIVRTYFIEEPKVHYRKKKKGRKLTAEEDAALMADMKRIYEPIGTHKGRNVTTKISRHLKVPELKGAPKEQAAPAPAPSVAPGADLVCLPEAEPNMSFPGDEPNMSFPGDEPNMSMLGDEPAVSVAEPAVAEPAAAKAESGWVVRARAYNKKHAEQAARFIEATGGACAGADGELDPELVARWQKEHGVDVDGRVGTETVKAATAKAHAEDHKDDPPAVEAEPDAQVAKDGDAVDPDVHSLPVAEHVAGDGKAPEPVKPPPKAPDKPKKGAHYVSGNYEQKKLGLYGTDGVGGIISRDKLTRNWSIKKGKQEQEFFLTDEQFSFKERVFDRAIARLGKKIYGGVADEELAPIGHERVRKEVVGPLKGMIAALKRDLGSRYDVWVSSGYRDPVEDFGIWDKGFNAIYLWDTQKHREKTWPDRPYGPEAVEYTVKQIGKRKAAPGGSNHSNGIAVDLAISIDGDRIGASFKNQKAYAASPQYEWLIANCQSHGFRNYSEEVWHYDYKPNG